MKTFIICACIVCIVGIIAFTVYRCIKMVLEFNKDYQKNRSRQ